LNSGTTAGPIPQGEHPDLRDSQMVGATGFSRACAVVTVLIVAGRRLKQSSAGGNKFSLRDDIARFVQEFDRISGVLQFLP
jgi:hypothetical protein